MVREDHGCKNFFFNKRGLRRWWVGGLDGYAEMSKIMGPMYFM